MFIPKLKKIYRNKKMRAGMLSLPLALVGTLFYLQAIDQTKTEAHTVTLVQTNQKEVITNGIAYNPVDLSLSQYSDQHVSPSAIVSDARFSNLTLADFVRADNTVTTPSSEVAAVLNALQTSTKKEYGTWLWTPLLMMSPSYIDSILSEAQKNNITVIYLSIDSYLDIYSMPEGPDKEAKKKEFAIGLENFIKQAQQKGIAVDAEAGWRNWAEDGNQYKAFAIINFIKNFNNSETYTLRGFQYDVEPYLLDSYKTDKASVLKDFLTLIDQSITLLKNSDLKLSVVIPDFYDAGANATPPFAYNGTTTYAYNHLLDSLEVRPGSSIIVMSYRNFAAGTDGSIDISQSELNTAENDSYHTHVIIAQETGDVMPPYITFNNTSKQYFSSQVAKIDSAFDANPNFGGVAVHYVNAFITLK